MSGRKKNGPVKARLDLDFEGVLSRDHLRPLQFVHGAFLASCLGIMGMTFLTRPVGSTPHGSVVVQFLSICGMALWIVGYIFGMWWFNRRMKPEVLQRIAQGPFRGPRILAEGATVADKISHHLRTIWTIRLTAWSIGPLVSLVSVQVAIQGNLVRQDVSFVTTGMFPMIVFLAIAILTFPTADRVRAILQRLTKG